MPPAAGSAAVPAAGGSQAASTPTPAGRLGPQQERGIGLLDGHDGDMAGAGYLQHFLDIRRRIGYCSRPRRGLPLNQLRTASVTCAPGRSRWPAVSASGRLDPLPRSPQPLREVEILHDRLLAAFNADPGLRPAT